MQMEVKSINGEISLFVHEDSVPILLEANNFAKKLMSDIQREMSVYGNEAIKHYPRIRNILDNELREYANQRLTDFTAHVSPFLRGFIAADSVYCNFLGAELKKVEEELQPEIDEIDKTVTELHQEIILLNKRKKEIILTKDSRMKYKRDLCKASLYPSIKKAGDRFMQESRGYFTNEERERFTSGYRKKIEEIISQYDPSPQESKS